MKKSAIFSLSKGEFSKMLQRHSREGMCRLYRISNRTLSRAIQYYGMNRENYGRKHLTPEIVEQIRSQPHRTQQSIAEEYGVSQSLICKIINNHLHKPRASFSFGGSAAVRSQWR